jgi:hypothetical protein
MIQRIGKGGMLAKADIKSAFRLLKVAPSDFDQLGFRFEGKYYFDKCLPMGASISCSIFENFSTALHWFTELQCHNKNILHYLDDFLLGGPAESPLCQITLDTFRDVCKTWGVPLAEDKTVEPVQILTFLGIEFDTLKMELRLPSEKISEIKIMLELFMHVRKVTLRQLQSLIGLLNFACQVIALGRAFCRRLIDATCGVRKAHHKIRISKSIKEDLIMWQTFLSNYNGVTVMLDTAWTSADSIEFFTDSAGGKQRGFGIYFQGRWAQANWPNEWAENGTLADITFLELFPVVVAISIWGLHLRNKKLTFNIDNKSVVYIINRKSSKSPRVMALVRTLVLQTLIHNIVIKAVHIPGKLNSIADSLSRSDFQKFRQLCPGAEDEKTPIPNHLWTS